MLPKRRAAGAIMSDDEVRAFIRSKLAVDRSLRHTRLLRTLREGGRACEQGRFRRLFKEVTSS